MIDDEIIDTFSNSYYDDETAEQVRQQAEHERSLINWWLEDETIKERGAVLNSDIVSAIKTILKTYDQLTESFLNASSDKLRADYQDSLTRSDHELDYLLELH